MKKKRCIKCGKHRLLKFFYEHPRMKDGHLNHCVACHARAGRTNYNKNVEYYRKYNRDRQREWRKKPGSEKKTREYKARYKKTHPERLRELRRRKNIRGYGITPEEHKEMVKKQKNRCAACGGPPTGRWKKLVIDHCHKTKKVRGLLCSKCNTAAGHLNDDPRKASSLARYLSAA